MSKEESQLEKDHRLIWAFMGNPTGIGIGHYKSWRHLMPVCTKLGEMNEEGFVEGEEMDSPENEDFYDSFDYKFLEQVNLTSTLEEVHNAVVSFLSELNKVNKYIKL